MRDSEMLLDLYACAGQPQGWPLLLDRLCEETHARSAVLQAFRMDHDAVQVVWQATDTRTAQRATSAGRLGGSGNPRIERTRMLRGVNRVVRDDDIFERGEAARETLRHQLAQAGLGAFLGTLQARPDGFLLGIALHRAAEDRGDFDRCDAARLETLAPHFGQACELGWRLRSAQAETRRLWAHLDSLRCGVLVCDADARVQWLNRSAQSHIDENTGLAIRGGSLHGRVPAQSARLREEIATVARGTAGEVSYLALGIGRHMLHLALRSYGEGGDEPAGVAVVITNARSLVQVPADAWCSLMGVSPAEASLVASLAQGRTLEEHAARRGITIGTARNQLKQALAKTDTSRQVELVRLALTSAAAHVLRVLPEPPR